MCEVLYFLHILCFNEKYVNFSLFSYKVPNMMHWTGVNLPLSGLLSTCLKLEFGVELEVSLLVDVGTSLGVLVLPAVVYVYIST